MISWRETRPFDYILLGTAIALTAYGLVLIYSGTLTSNHGELVEVLAPADLRQEFHRRATAMAALYQRSSQAVTTHRRTPRKR